mmetsp:Transcript_18242/g.37724  ORF Transcript_18242/g.37724 Transcript_18242/m.37724 type:complete len:106 (-) Transcript_18242:3-320(-)
MCLLEQKKKIGCCHMRQGSKCRLFCILRTHDETKCNRLVDENIYVECRERNAAPVSGNVITIMTRATLGFLAEILVRRSLLFDIGIDAVVASTVPHRLNTNILMA